MRVVSTVNPALMSVQAPEPLRSLPGWLTWRYELHDGEDKPRKVPYYTSGTKRHGVQGRPDDRAALTTFEAARRAAAKSGHDGMAFAPMPEWGICIVDFDGCIDGAGIQTGVLDAIVNTYAEFSPSGNGVHAFVLADLGNRKDPHGKPFGVETFSSKGFVTFTGNALEYVDLAGMGNTVAPANEALTALCLKRFGERVSEQSSVLVPPIGLTERQLRDGLDAMDADMPREDWIKVGMALHHETGGGRLDLWDGWSSRGRKYPGAQALHSQWEGFSRREGSVVTAASFVRLARASGAHIDLRSPTASDFDVVEEPEPAETAKSSGSDAAKQEKNRFEVQSLAAFAAGRQPEWLIKGVLPKAELVVLFGESGAGKSFMALDLAGAMARGVSWRGHRTKQARVVYVAAEGAVGFRNRVRAYASANAVDLGDVPIGVIHAAPNLMLRPDAVDVAQAIHDFGGADVVIVDTFAQVTPGANENAGEHMGKALGHCKDISRGTGAVVVLVHHAGKDLARGARGWSGIRAAADAELEVVRYPVGHGGAGGGGGERVMRASKQKDGQDGQEWGFELVVVPVGLDEDGDVVTSCVVHECAVPVGGTVLARPLGVVEQAVKDAIDEIAASQTQGIEIKAVAALAASRLPESTIVGRDTRKQKAMRVINAWLDDMDSLYERDGECLNIL